MKKLVLILLVQFGVTLVYAQVTLRGIVTGADNQPLPGADVVIMNSYSGQTTGSDGSFIFDHLKLGKYILSVTYIGYERKEIDINVEKSLEITVQLDPTTIFTEEVLVRATRAQGKMPIAHTDLDKKELESHNLGQDIPYLLSLTPSFVSSSDAGTGIGYTGFRVRGTDVNRINVTMNGIPLNDAESHATFFVDFPDLVSSAENVQVQRGAGTSVNGGAAFGASINLQTLTLKRLPHAEIHSSAGSFNTLKNTVSFGTGLIGQKFTFDGRISGIRSDGFIDRAWSHLKSYYISAGYYSQNTIIKANLFSGWEETYQAWNGVPSVRLKNDLAGMQRYEDHGLLSAGETAEMIASGSRTYNIYTYKNQIDHYQQDHYQLYFSHRFTPDLNLNIALHFTYGRGYYEEFKAGQKFSNYGLTKPVISGTEITRTDLVRRKWLDNDFLGSLFSLNYLKNKIDFSWGGGWNNYDGRHFGKLVWGQHLGKIEPDHEWYRNTGIKIDMNSYVRINYELTSGFNLFADLQYRIISYRIEGIDDDLRELGQQHLYHFFNPKAGIFYRINSLQDIYLAYARTHREPNRDNFVDTPPGGALPGYETLNDFEAGWNVHSALYNTSICLYLMNYHDQLALTGQINDVGAPVMLNVDKSYRLGLEMSWGIRLSSDLRWDANVTLSRNKIADFTEWVDDWNTGDQKSFNLGNTDLAFSPAVTGNSQLEWSPGKFSFNLISTLVGKQYIDNTSSSDRSIDAYFISGIKARYSVKTRFFSDIKIHLMANNLMNEKYESNAWVYSYYLEGKRYKMDGYFPQAGISIMAGIDFSF